MSDSVQQALNSKMDEEDQKVLKEVGTFLFTANSGRRRGLTVEQLLEMPNRTEHDLNIDFNPSTVIPGPSQGLSEAEVCKVIVEERTRSRRGEAAMYWEEIQDEIADVKVWLSEYEELFDWNYIDNRITNKRKKHGL